jgi:hypothetical protein
VKSTNIQKAIGNYLGDFLSSISDEEETKRMELQLKFFQDNVKNKFADINLKYQINNKMDFVVKISQRSNQLKDK